MNLSGKVAIVTGGANGIGRCVAESFAKHGASLAIIDSDKDAGERLAERLGEKHIFFHGDVGQKLALERFSKIVLGQHQAIDFLVNNACSSAKGILSGCAYEDFSKTLNVGITAPYYLCLLFKDSFNPCASVVNISSTRAFQSQRDTESYSAAKGGITALTHALAMSLAGKARVNSISPGWIDTAPYHEGGAAGGFSPLDHMQHPSGRVGTPEDIAALVLFLCSGNSAFINAENIIADGGMTRRMIYHADEEWNYSKKI